MKRNLKLILVEREEFLKLEKCFKEKLLKIPTKITRLLLSICKRYSIMAKIPLMKRANVGLSPDFLKVGLVLKKKEGLRRSQYIRNPKINQVIK